MLISILDNMLFRQLIIITLMIAALSGQVSALDDVIIIQSTTSTQNSGLYDYLLPEFTKKSGIKAHIVAVGTGQALKNAQNCDGDVLLVHSKKDEETFVARGFGDKRFDVMYNDFVIIGPDSDPAEISAARSIEQALRQIASSKHRFVSRGDNSGTHKAELRLWERATISPQSASGQWYLEAGQGMGSTINLTIQIDGYTLSDRSTWLAFTNKGNHKIVFSGDPKLFNQYGVITVSAEHCPSVNKAGAQAFVDWIISTKGQARISAYRRGGEQLFFANAN